MEPLRMKQSINTIVLAPLLLILCACQAPIQQGVTETSADTHYIDLKDINPDSLSYKELYDRTLGLWNTPFEERDCDTKLGKAHVLIAGPKDAPPLVLLHGMNASSTSWYPNIEYFAATHRVYAIDFILEINKSEMTTEPDGTQEIMNWYREVFDCLGLESFDLLGASRGGWLATQIAINQPKKVKKLVLLSPAQTFVWIPASKKMLQNLLYTMRPNREDLRKSLEALSNDVGKVNQLYIDQYYRASTQSEVDASIFEMTPLSDDDLAALTMPVLLLIGENDFANNDKSLEKANEDIGNVEAHKIANAGHFLSIDQADEVNKLVIEFLDR